MSSTVFPVNTSFLFFWNHLFKEESPLFYIYSSQMTVWARSTKCMSNENFHCYLPSSFCFSGDWSVPCFWTIKSNRKPYFGLRVLLVTRPSVLGIVYPNPASGNLFDSSCLQGALLSKYFSLFYYSFWVLDWCLLVNWKLSSSSIPQDVSMILIGTMVKAKSVFPLEQQNLAWLHWGDSTLRLHSY